ncbi:hypothetical protein ACP70R_025877 [Stipagrostis hirtigluma subsp. patula]
MAHWVACMCSPQDRGASCKAHWPTKSKQPRSGKAIGFFVSPVAGRTAAMESGSGEPAGKAASAAEKLCRRCKVSYDPSANTRLSCRFHPSFFVCRRHDDQKRYYELRDGDPPYAAKFYDCCGAEDPDAPGCTTDFHRSYDDATD